MYIAVDPAEGTARLEEADVFTAFHVSAPEGVSAHQILATMGSLGKACDLADHVWVSVSGVRELASGGAEWTAGFEAMMGYAASKGWTDDTGQWIQAHIEWGQSG